MTRVHEQDARAPGEANSENSLRKLANYTRPISSILSPNSYEVSLGKDTIVNIDRRFDNIVRSRLYFFEDCTNVDSNDAETNQLSTAEYRNEDC